MKKLTAKDIRKAAKKLKKFSIPPCRCPHYHMPIMEPPKDWYGTGVTELIEPDLDKSYGGTD